MQNKIIIALDVSGLYMCETSQWCRSSQILNPQPPQNPLNYYNTATTQIFEIHEIKHNSYKINQFSTQNHRYRETQRKRHLFTGAPIPVTM